MKKYKQSMTVEGWIISAFQGQSPDKLSNHKRSFLNTSYTYKQYKIDTEGIYLSISILISIYPYLPIYNHI